MTWQDQNELARQDREKDILRRGEQRAWWLRCIIDEERLIRNAKASAKRQGGKTKPLQRRLDRLLKWKRKLQHGLPLQHMPNNLFGN